MPTFFSKGSPETEIDSNELKQIVDLVFTRFGTKNNVLVVPPDFTRFPSRAGEITCLLHEHYKETITEVKRNMCTKSGLLNSKTRSATLLSMPV